MAVVVAPVVRLAVVVLLRALLDNRVEGTLEAQKAQKKYSLVPFVLLVFLSSYLEAGRPNLPASIATFVFTSLIFAVYRPSSQEN